MPDVSREKVMVVPAALLDELGRFQGFCAEVDRYLSRLLDPSQITFRPRSQVEEDPGFKQIIPYCILHCSGQLFRYRRGKGMGEKRLHALESIGVGGHISIQDDRPLIAGTDETYWEAMQRELAEEVTIRAQYSQRCVGLINDDSTPVGQVHLGVVHLFDLSEPAVEPRERSLLRARFVPVEQVRQDRDKLETWSQFCLEALFP